ncbi:MAG: aromatic ring-hydroxylating dioxygenase subunit alpha [Rubrivivax sp.]|nr:aromatic ring-hydroxylating dioxygenase subunit alpha [Rubrivivax sp.]
MSAAAGPTRGDARWWHPVAGLDELIGPGPWPLRLLGQDLVLWRSLGGLQAFDDRCPHRGARLSLGRVVDDQLQCAYHGWCFDSAGACRSVPALPGFVPPTGHAVAAWQVATAHGLIWLARDPLQPAPPACEGVPQRRVVCGPYTVETSAPRVVENFLDTSHFAFVHEGWLGDAGHPEVPAYAVDHTADGRPLIPHYRAWQPRASASSDQGAWVDYRYEVLSPYTALLQKQPEGGGVADAYTAFACPLDEDRTRVWFLQYTSDTATPDAELQAFQDSIFGQDRPVLESQRPQRLPISGGELHSAADRLSAAYRRWLQLQVVGFGVC